MCINYNTLAKTPSGLIATENRSKLSAKPIRKLRLFNPTTFREAAIICLAGGIALCLCRLLRILTVWTSKWSWDFGLWSICIWRSDSGFWGYYSGWYDGQLYGFGLGKLLTIGWGPG